MNLSENTYMRDTAFLVSQPLQILVALSVIKQKEIEKTSYLVIIGTFYNAKLVYERMKITKWQMSSVSIKFFETHKEAHHFVRSNSIKNIFTDGDVGFKKHIDLLTMKLCKPSLSINVYEEGLGTYRTDLYSGAKKFFFDAVGIGTSFGGSSLTKSLYLFNPEHYREKFPKTKTTLQKIHLNPVDMVKLYFEPLSFIFQYTPASENRENLCHVYLSSWSVDYNFLEKFSALPGDRYIKLHPRAKVQNENICHLLTSRTAPAEMILVDLMKKYNSITVYHHGSSVEKYVSGENISFVRL